MMSLNYMHQSREDIAWQSESEHKSLRLFDSHSDNRSRIPVLVDRENVAKLDRHGAVSHHSKPGDNSSKIPVYKASPTNLEETFRSLSIAASRQGQETSTLKKRTRLPPGSKHSDFASKSRKTVKLHGLELTSIPTDIFSRTDLESLILSPERESCLDFKLPFLPSAVGQLTKLKTLVLDTNELQDIPDEIENLQGLETLVLGNNHLSQLPQGLHNLDRLKSLHLANNRFEEMPPTVCHLASLRFLDMSNNVIQSLPSEICQLAGSLNTLLLIMNKLESLPDSFSLLTSLTCLWLGENNLSELPEDFGELYKLDWGRHSCSSNIDGNPLMRPPLSVCQKGPLEIRKYFHHLNRKAQAKLPPSSMNRIAVKTNSSCS